MPTLRLLNHSLRVFEVAEWYASVEQSQQWTHEKRSLLCVACLLHDIGCARQFDGPQRFEVEGADAAADYLRQRQVPESDIHEVWTAITLHTTPGIAERISVLARVVRLAVRADFGTELEDRVKDIRFAAEQSFPRLDIEKILADVMVEQAEQQPQKAPAACWPGILLRSKKEWPDWSGVNRAC